jgi:hypothetical protein
MLGLCPQIGYGRPHERPSPRIVGRNSEAYCAICADGGSGGIRFAIPPYVLHLPKRRSHDLHVVRCHQLLVRIGIHTLPLREHHFEPTGRDTEQQYTGLRPDVLERVRSNARNEDKGSGGRAHNAFAQFEVELTAHNVTKLGFHFVQVRRGTALGCDGLTKEAEHTSSSISRRQ